MKYYFADLHPMFLYQFKRAKKTFLGVSEIDPQSEWGLIRAHLSRPAPGRGHWSVDHYAPVRGDGNTCK